MRDLAALAEHPHGAVPQIELAEVEADELRQPQARGVEQLHEGAVARGQRPRLPASPAAAPSGRHRASVAAGAALSVRARPGRGWRARVPDRRRRRCAARRRPRAAGSRRSCAPPTAAAGCCAARGPPACACAAKAAHVLRVERAPVGEALPVAEPHQRREVARVAGVGMRGQAPLGAQVAAEARQPLERRGSHDCLNERGGLSA